MTKTAMLCCVNHQRNLLNVYSSESVWDKFVGKNEMSVI